MLDDAPNGAEFSEDRRYRYRLWRKTTQVVTNRTLLCLMLNPSDADEKENDPTVTRCMVRATMLQCDKLEIANIFALVSKDPAELRKPGYSASDLIGERTNGVILAAALNASLVLCGGGNLGTLHGRGEEVRKMLENAGIQPNHLRLTNSGNPYHPLYVGYKYAPKPWVREPMHGV